MLISIKIFATFALMSVCTALRSETEIIPGFYTARFVADFSNALPIQLWPIECDTYNQNVPSGVFYRCYENKWQCDDELILQITEDGIIEKDYDLIVRDSDGIDLAALDSGVQVLTEANKTVYTWRLTAQERSFCNRTVVFYVRDWDLALDIAHSDAHSFHDVVKDSVLITYYHHKNAFGLIYDYDASPAVIQFNLRIPAIFYHERTPKEQTDIVLTNQIINSSSVMFKQRLLEIDMLPYYMHEKIQLALSHQFVEIINKRWRQREAYELREGNRKVPHKAATCLLNQENYVQRSIL